MKKDIHPKYYPSAKVVCACGNMITTGSTKSEMKVEVCSACHPFYTGKKRLVDSTGRLDRFKKRMEKSESLIAQKLKMKAEKKKPKALKIEKKENSIKTVKAKTTKKATKVVKPKAEKKPRTAKAKK